MSNLKRRLDAIEASKHLQALRWVEQNPDLFAQFIGFIAAIEQLGGDPLAVQLIQDTMAPVNSFWMLRDSSGKQVTTDWGADVAMPVYVAPPGAASENGGW